MNFWPKGEPEEVRPPCNQGDARPSGQDSVSHTRPLQWGCDGLSVTSPALTKSTIAFPQTHAFPQRPCKQAALVPTSDGLTQRKAGEPTQSQTVRLTRLSFFFFFKAGQIMSSRMRKPPLVAGECVSRVCAVTHFSVWGAVPRPLCPPVVRTDLRQPSPIAPPPPPLHPTPLWRAWPTQIRPYN